MHQKRHRMLHGRIFRQCVQRRRFRDGFAVLNHSSNVQRQCFGSHTVRFLQRPASGNAAWKIRKADAEIGVPVFVQICEVVHDAKLPPTATDHLSLIPVCISMLLRVPIGRSRFGCGTVARPFFRRVLELLVAANPIDFVPAVAFQLPDYVPTIHSFQLNNTHFVRTYQSPRLRLGAGAGDASVLGMGVPGVDWG
jgi:hypothetical protein